MLNVPLLEPLEHLVGGVDKLLGLVAERFSRAALQPLRGPLQGKRLLLDVLDQFMNALDLAGVVFSGGTF